MITDPVPLRAAGLAAWCAAGLVVVVVTAGMLTMTPAIEGDHLWAILAAEQALLGRSTSVSQIVLADPNDLGRDRIQRVTWSAPGHQEAIYALQRSGFTLGAALKAAIVGAWLIGIAAWAAYFTMVVDDKRLAPWLIAAFACFRISHYHAFVYLGGDMLEWAAFPLAALANVGAAQETRARTAVPLAVLAGVLTGGLAIFKYSAAFLTIAAGVFWAWTAWRRDARPATLLAWAGGAMGGGLVAIAAGVGQVASGSTPASASSAAVEWLPVAIWSAGGWLAALTDSGALIESIGRNAAGAAIAPDRAAVLSTVGLGALFLAWLIVSRRPVPSAMAGQRAARAPAQRLAVATVSVVAAGLFVLTIRGGAISMEGRHQQYGAFLCLPLLAGAFVRGAREGSPAARALSTLCLAVFLGAPSLYGAAALADKVFLRSPHLRAGIGPDGVRIDLFGQGGDAVSFYRETRAQPGFDDALLVTDSPAMPILFPANRALILPGDEVDLPWRQTTRPPIDLVGKPPGGVALLIPRALDRKSGAAIRRAFTDVDDWRPADLKTASSMSLWFGRSR